MKFNGFVSRHHHNDFRSGQIDTDPCDIYELVSSTRIHHGDSDNHLMNKEHTDDIRGFNACVLSIRRDNRLNDLGI